jgi:hypothetical protein
MAHTDGPVFVEFVVAKEDNVYPMIPAGQTIEEMIDSPLTIENATGKVVTLQKGIARKEEHHVHARR